MGYRTTPLLVLMLAGAAVSASAQHSAKKSSQKTDALLQSAMARLQDNSMHLTLAGQILMPDGSAATNARLYVSTNNNNGGALEEIKLDPTGRFRRPLDFKGNQPVEALVLSAIVPGKAVLWRTYATSDKTLSKLALQLEPATTLTGRVVDLNGKPLSGIDVNFPHIGPDRASLRQVSASTERITNVPLTEFLPASMIKALYQTKTDQNGHFTLLGLPMRGQLHPKFGSNLMPAPGSSAGIDLGNRKQVDAGILVAVAPGAIALHLTDRSTGKPAVGIQAMVVPKNLSVQDFSGQQADDAQATRALLSGLNSDEKGDITVPHLAPGEYRILMNGTTRMVTVTEAHTTRLDLTMRTGPLTGRIVDANGKPIANLPVTVDMTQDPLKDAFGSFGMSAGQGDHPTAQTDLNGRFVISPFPWDSTSVTLRSAKGNAEAKWSGSAQNIGKTLELRLRPDALITVTGHLVDPAYHHVKNTKATLIRWQDGPRITWFANGTEVQIDAQGRFQVSGLQRGESFSLLAGSPFGGGSERLAEDFESPRFTTNQAAGVQNLGDVVVHPLDSGEQILQIYGIGSREQLAQLGALIPPPSSASVEAAREALARYGSAVAAGDFDKVHQLTSHFSTGWSEDRREFLSRSAFPIPVLQDVQPLRFVPGISLAYLISLSNSSFSPFNFSFGAAASDLETNPDWVVFAGAGPEAVRIAGLAHREQGEWKVVSVSSVFGEGLDGLFLLDATGGTTAPRPAGFTRPAPALEAAQIEAARTTGEKYLTAWSHNDDATQLALTSPLSTCAAANLADLRKAKKRRTDEGICPVSDMTALHLTPLTGVTQWESEWLAEYARKFDEISGQQGSTLKPDVEKQKGFPGKYVERGDLISFSYSVDGHDFLILMIKHAEGWQVLEPALPH